MKMNSCVKCGGKGKKTIERRFGIPSGDLGYQAVIECKSCERKVITWALCKSWANESIYKKWNGED